jgi:hypothetical protein
MTAPGSVSHCPFILRQAQSHLSDAMARMPPQ